MTTVDLQTKSDFGFWALLCLQNGDQYDVYGNTLSEVREEAKAIAESIGIEIDTWNMELPE